MSHTLNLKKLSFLVYGLGSTGYSATGNQTASEEYDGSSWSVGGALVESHNCAGTGAGSQAAGLYMGGGNPSNFIAAGHIIAAGWR